ncbi:hypothetical protein Dimus_017508 [Dionaea muscipula]
MDFDEYEYLEKSVEDPKNRSGSSLKKKEGSEKREKAYRKREDSDDVEDEEEERRSKKSRSGEKNGERRREDRERSERKWEKDERHRSDRDGGRGRDSRDIESRDRDNEREKEKERRERKERERGMEKGRERDENDRGRSEREKSSSRTDSRERERERERERRSSSRSRRHDSRERVKERERSSSRSRRHDSRERELREKEREVELRDSRRLKEKKEVAEPEADPERDQRTVFAYQMPLKATERDVYEFFSKAGKVRDVRLIMDRNSRRSKGVGYVEFFDAMSVPMAIALSGQLFFGQPVMVKPSEAEKNLVQSTSGGGSSVTGPYGPTDRKLYVGNLHFSTTEHQLRQIFESFGPVELVQLPLDLETGQCKGFGFVQFAQVEHAKAAQTLNGQLEIAGRCIKVSSVTDHVVAQDTGTNTADFDDDDGGGLALSAQSRAILMQKLDRTGTASSIVGSLGAPVLNGSAPILQPIALPANGQGVIPPAFNRQVLTAPTHEPIGIPSECLLLKNLFDPATESEPDFDLDIKDDVHEECSKFGRVRHIYVDRNSAGHVYLRFDSKEAAVNAQRGMHLRWFARRLISAVFLSLQEYESKFRDGS